MFDLTGKTALVTGASGGIGGAIAAMAIFGAGRELAGNGTGLLAGVRGGPIETSAQRCLRSSELRLEFPSEVPAM